MEYALMYLWINYTLMEALQTNVGGISLFNKWDGEKLFSRWIGELNGKGMKENNTEYRFFSNKCDENEISLFSEA